MRAEFFAAPAHGALGAAVQFADWDRPALGGNSLGLFACAWSAQARPDLVEIVLLDGAQCVARIAPLHTTREVLATLCPGHEERAVFGHACVNRLVLPEEGALEVAGVDAAGVRHALGQIRYAGNDIASLVGRYDLGLRPILVTSLGRSGSTVLAHALGLHPEVAAIGGYPFEYRFFSYCLHAAYVLTSPAGHAHSMGGDAFENRHPFAIGFNPFNHRDYDRVLGHDSLRDWYEGPHAEATARFFMGQAREALAIAARGKPAATAFVEKMGGSLLANVAHHLCAGTREIVLLRSFWDVARSMIAFDAKRGTTGFFSAAGREEADAWLRDLAEQQRHLERRARLRGMVTVRYEALVGDPQATLARVATELGLDAGTVAVAAMCEAVGTSDYSASHSTRGEQGSVDFDRLFSPGALAAAREMHTGASA